MNPVNTSGITQVNRRNFLKTGATAAGGLMLGLHLGTDEALAQGAQGASLPELNAFISVGTDDVITLQIHKSEMGQGVITSLVQIFADELEADWSKIRTEFPGVRPEYGNPMMGTYGSLSIRTGWNPLRRAAASAREMLVQAAANQWGVDPSVCRAENSKILNTQTNARVSYGSVAAAAAALTPPDNPTLKTADQYRYIGTSPQRLDTPMKTNGTAPFGMDFKTDGMKYAAVERCPVFEGTVASFDDTEAKRVPGVTDAFSIGHGVVVIADNTWSAFEGRKKLKITWDEGPRAGNSTEGLRKMFAEMCEQPGRSVRNDGDVDTAMAGAAKVVEAVYEAPYLSHAPMEPLNATILVTDNHADLWVGSQIQTVAQQAVMQATGLSADQIDIHTQYLGGGFGRRGGEDYIHEAAEIGAHMKGTPVKVTWTREDDLQHDTYRPMSYTKFRAGLDAEGWPVALHARIACPPFGSPGTPVEGIEDMRYDIANVRVEHHAPDVGVPVSYWRSVGYSQNTPFMEGFIDELAVAAGKDPLEYRRKLLANDARLLGVLNLAAEKAGWGTPLPAGRFRGIAAGRNIGSYSAQVAEISIVDNRVKVHRVVYAIDCGVVVNPAIVQQQIEGGVVYGLSAGLKQEITLAKGRVVQQNFHNFDALRIDEMPVVETHIMPSTENPGGIGEASTPTAPGAVMNAIFAATGKRVRVMPIKTVA